jgi:hypothetical protein
MALVLAAPFGASRLYLLASAGLGLGYAYQLFAARLSDSSQTTGNHGLDANGDDSEGENRKHPLWLQVSTHF